MSRLCEEEKNEVEVNFLYNSFSFEMTESKMCGSLPIPGMRAFLEHLTSIYPNVKRVRRRSGGKWQTLYRGISVKSLNPIICSGTDLKDILKYLPTSFQVVEVSDKCLKCSIESGCLTNGNKILKHVTFHQHGVWELRISGKSVNLKSAKIENTYTLDEESVVNVCNLVNKMNICHGVGVKTTVLMSRFHTLDNFQPHSDSATIRTLRSVSCNGITPFEAKTYTCQICRKMTFNSPEPKLKENINPCKEDENVDKIKHLLKHANKELLGLFLEQSKNIARDKRGHRWSKSFIGTCLQLYNRSPHSYRLLVSSNILVLPSCSTLIMYKNKLNQTPGFDQSVFEWMLDEAKRRGIPDEGMVGGLIFDEMTIQSDIQIDKNGDVVELAGFTSLGQEGDLCHTLRKGEIQRNLGTHVLQLLFLGISGFRFPFAHFVTDTVQASEIYGLFWTAVKYLWTYKFRVLYTCMDGAVCNRSFMHICVGDNNHLNYKFLSPSPVTFQPMIFIMDVSHVLKKIRNNIIKSGIGKKCTRTLTLPSGYTIQWQMFIDTFMWDKQNSLQLHRKLTDEHIFPDSQSKMRNALAEDVLNSEMLHLIKVYKNALGEKGEILNGAVELLEKTSQIIKIFRDMRPVIARNDQRLDILRDVGKWFLDWERYVHENKKKGKQDVTRLLMSSQCHEDVQSCIQGFIMLCENVFKMTTSVHVTPGLVNSDVIENVFNQQRSTYNGANTNPNALQYKKTINSILVGQNTISRKSNAGNSMASAVPFIVEMTKKSKKQKTIPPPSSSNIKVLRL